jgi:hypothetical protein
MNSTNGAKPRAHQALNAGRLCRDRGRSGLVRPRQWIPQSTRMHSTTAAPRSSRRSLPSWCATATSVTSSRGRPFGSSPSTGGKPTPTSTRGPGAGLLCLHLRVSAWHRCSTSTTSTTASSCPSSCIGSTIREVPLFGIGRDQRARRSRARRTRISRPSSRPCVNTGCRSVSARTPSDPGVEPRPAYANLSDWPEEIGSIRCVGSPSGP